MESLRRHGLRDGLLSVLFFAAGCTATVDKGAASGTGAAPANASGGSGTTGNGGMDGTGAVGSTGGPGSGGTAGPGAGGAGAPVVLVPPAYPGVVVARRLNQTEYNNTVRDLLGTSLKPATDFPPDDLGAEFDTVGSALSLSPSYVVGYDKAAYALVDDLLVTTDAARRLRVISCNVDTAGDTCAKTILTGFARRAWRRPVTAEEAQGLMLPVTTARTLGATPADGLRHALAGVLLSPFFIFKLEIDPDPTSLQVRRLGSHELATRLSYALWATTPDDILLAAADAGALATDQQVATQVERMLADARASSLLDNFAADWLEFKHLETHEVELTKFPKYTPALAQSMKAEARRFVQEYLQADLPVAQMLDARFTFIDSVLATHYGLTRPAGMAATVLARVDTTNAPRAGLLTLGAFLTTTSFSARTSPVVRGQFVFNRLLCGSVSPPPGDIPALPEDPTLTGRQLAEQHRSKPECMGCHAVMDPIGFGLENYDAIGAYRTKDGANDINAMGTLPDGSTFNGAIELANTIARDPRFARCVTNKFMTFAVGRLLNQRDDQAWVNYISSQAQQARNGSLGSIIRNVVLSDGFRSRQAIPSL